MRRIISITLPVLLLSACSEAPTTMNVTEKIAPPVAPKRDHAISAHGNTRNDEYYWMRLTEEQRNTNPPDAHTKEVVDHLNAENAYTEAVLSPVKQLREDLFKEMKARIKETDLSVPYRENGYWYQQRFDEGKEYAVHVRAKAEGSTAPAEGDAAWKVMLNENVLAEGHSYFDLGDYEISPNNNIVGYSTDKVSRRQYEIHFRDLTTGEELADVITNTSGGCAWADDKTVFYSRKDKTLRTYRIYRHVMGSDPAKDVIVFEEKDPAYSCDVYRARSERYVMIATESTLSSEHHFLSVDEPMGAFKVFLPREEEHEHSVMHVQG
ncbi:MAG TPA: oligopeptidase B, partial [Flavobacteriales bacterium]|nr:oligopeptidase B [Flavobacteriales bacterium]